MLGASGGIGILVRSSLALAADVEKLGARSRDCSLMAYVNGGSRVGWRRDTAPNIAAEGDLGPSLS